MRSLARRSLYPTYPGNPPGLGDGATQPLAEYWQCTGLLRSPPLDRGVFHRLECKLHAPAFIYEWTMMRCGCKPTGRLRCTAPRRSKLAVFFGGVVSPESPPSPPTASTHHWARCNRASQAFLNAFILKKMLTKPGEGLSRRLREVWAGGQYLKTPLALFRTRRPLLPVVPSQSTICCVVDMQPSRPHLF